jgi:hypothetical protein
MKALIPEIRPFLHRQRNPGLQTSKERPLLLVVLWIQHCLPEVLTREDPLDPKQHHRSPFRQPTLVINGPKNVASPIEREYLPETLPRVSGSARFKTVEAASGPKDPVAKPFKTTAMNIHHTDDAK